MLVAINCAFAQYNHGNQNILYSGSNATPKSITIGSATPIAGYPLATDRGLELYSTSSTLFTMKTGVNLIQLLNSPTFGNNLYMPNNIAFSFFMAGVSNPALRIQTNGNIGINTTLNPIGYKLAVGGKIIAEELKVQLQAQWPDYVFAKDYKLPTLFELEKRIQENGHLPNMPSALDVKENGIELGEMAKMQQEKIEELTLYIIELNKKLEKQNKKLDAILLLK